jgi:hypothetical protein
MIEATIKTYSCLSTDTKPTTAGGVDVPNGSRLREVDTDAVYYYNLADDTWYLVNTLTSIADPTTGDQAGVNADGQLHVVMEGKVCTANSTATPLPADTSGVDHIFTGTAIETLPYAVINVAVFADVASATDGMRIDQSTDGTNWEHCDEFSIPAGTGKTYSVQPQARYLRVRYINGTSAQSAFRLQTTLKKTYVKPSSHRIGDNVSSEDDAELVKASLTGEDPAGTHRNVKTTVDGDLTVSDNSSGLSIARGNVTGTSFIHKFGNAPDFDVGDGFVTVWDGAEDDEDYENMVYDYSNTADIDYIVAEDDTDTQDVEIQGLDSNYDVVIQTKALTGNTPAELDTYLIRVFRMRNVNSTDFGGHVFCYVSGGTVTGGVPQVGADVRAVIHSVNNQTEMALFTIPAGKTGYMRDWYASTAGAKRDSSHTIKVLARPFGGVFQLKHTANIGVTGTSYIKHDYTEPEKFTEKTDIEIRVNTDVDIAGVAAGFDIVLVDN